MKRNRFEAPDDQPLLVYRQDISGGMNNRQHEQVIGENQAVLLQNIILDTAGQLTMRSGQTLVDANFPPIYLLDETGKVLLDENNIPLLQEGQLV